MTIRVSRQREASRRRDFHRVMLSVARSLLFAQRSSQVHFLLCPQA